MAKNDAVILMRKHNGYMREIVNLRAEETAEKKMIAESKAAFVLCCIINTADF